MRIVPHFGSFTEKVWGIALVKARLRLERFHYSEF